jgi:hypothetical protein
MIAGVCRAQRRERQSLPLGRQKIPDNRLKNKEKTSPGSFAARVQRLEAVWHARRRHCGLEIAG